MSIIYEPEFFNSVKNQVNKDNIDEKIKDLIKKLTEEYNCFKNLKEYEKKNNFYKHNKKKIYPKISKPKTDDKIVLSYLNKITFDNYEILSKKIISNIRDNNFKMIIDKLLIISFKQYNYSKLYLDLYKAILDDDEKKNYLNNKICEIIINKNGDLNVLINNENINKLNYDDFCDNNKEKKNLKGKINIIINLIKSEIIEITKEMFYKNLIKYKDYNNEIYLEILQIVNNNIKLSNELIEDLQNYLDKNDFKGRMMIKFKIKDIIDNKIIKEF